MRLKEQFNLNTVFLGGVGVALSLGLHKLNDTFESVTRSEVEIRVLSARVDKVEDRLNRFIEENDGLSRDRGVRSPKDSANRQ